MENQRVRYVWGTILLLVGAYLMAVNFNLLPSLTINNVALFFGALSLLFFGSYFASGIRNFGWLFPAFMMAAIAVIIGLADTNVDGTILGSLPLFAVSVPFWIVFALNRRENWWALIPAWSTAAIGGIILLSNLVSGEVIAGFVLSAIGLPFLVVYAMNRENWWALIPGGILSFMGAAFLIAGNLNEDLLGGLIVGGIGLAFLVVYLLNRSNWWAIIPAGVLGTVGVIAALSQQRFIPGLEDRILGGVFFGGMAVTFAILWLLRNQHETAWAGYPALGLGAAAALIAIFGTNFDQIWPVILIAFGLWLIYRNMRSRPQAE
ncbi:MAG: hypothetical protein DWQ07_04160 [Chloroflexi bacterium]|nr:MAG: hypothetical protein DWQ07_04160 [Chloroflexota bacterium]MBL1194627.1 hypothetical protein [Chloroflexota bacterium]NOH11917.1 hypothetical protein [Chloroflexota bacterium]